jgi:hypothetical protein
MAEEAQTTTEQTGTENAAQSTQAQSQTAQTQTTQTAQTQTSDIASFINPDGSFKEGWKKALLPEDLQNEKFYDTFATNIKDLAKTAGHQAKTIGKYSSTKGILPIGPNSSPFEVQQYREALGIPGDPSGYKYTPSEGFEIDQDALKVAMTDFHAANFAPGQVQAAMAVYEKHITKALADYDKQMQQATDEANAKMHNKYGPKLAQRQELSRRFIDKMAGTFSQDEYEALFGKEVEITNAAGLPEKSREGGINAPEFAHLRPFLLEMFANTEEKYGIEDSATIADANSPEAKSVEEQILELQKQIADGKLRSSMNPRDREKHQEILDKISLLTRRLPPKPVFNMPIT